MNFQIGDRVKAILPCDGNNEYVGEIGTVSRIDAKIDSCPIEVKFDNKRSWWCEKESLQLVSLAGKWLIEVEMHGSRQIIPTIPNGKIISSFFVEGKS